MLDNTAIRRCTTVAAVVIGFLVGTALAPLILAATANLRVALNSRSRRKWILA